MDQIYAWLGGVVATLIIMEMLLMLLPSGNFKKFVKVIAGIMVATMLISPLSRCSDIRVELNGQPAAESQQKNYEDFAMDVYNRNIINNNNT